MTNKSELELLTAINDKLDGLIAITATQSLERDEKIYLLAGMGYTNKDISTLCNIPKGTVDVVRAGRKK